MQTRLNFKKMFLILTLAAVNVLPAKAQQPQDLQQQLQELKQQYEQTTREMQQRIAALEEQVGKEVEKENAEKARISELKKESAVSATELAGAQEAKKIALGETDQVGAKYQGQVPSDPTYDLLQESETKMKTMEEQLGAFEFHGYLRSGYGFNSVGGQQVAFQAPGADAKFRLGNEAETYGEFIFVNNWLNPDRSSDKAWMKTEVMIEANTSNSDSYANFPGDVGNDQFRLREAFVQAGNLFDFQPGAKFWAGERYYRRQHVEIDDFYPLDTSGYGGGVEDWNLRIGKMAVAFLGGARPDVVTPSGNYAKGNIDVRLYDLKGPAGRMAFWFDYASAKGGTTQTGTLIPTTDGYAFGFRHQRLEWLGGYHAFFILYGKGAASNFSTSVQEPDPFLKSSEKLLIVEHMLLQPNDRFAIMPIFVFQRTRDGQPGHGFNDWASFGARPVVYFTKYLSLAFEAGFDHTSGYGLTANGNTQFDGWLRKFTIAPQIGAGRKFFSRPVLRVFLTYGNWSNGYRGLVGGIPFQDRTSGLTYGVQAETWW
jgi:maltoporin